MNRKLWKSVRTFWQDESGVGVVEIILILVVLISLVLLFKEQITSLVKTVLTKIKNQGTSV
ncbi:MAG: Flp1 family type IVb pilin [Lachnospiraceae bacterium]